MHRISLAEGDVLYREGEPAEQAYLILAGEMAMDRRAVTLGAGKGAVIGFSALVDRPYGATARAAGRVEVLAFTRKSSARCCAPIPTGRCSSSTASSIWSAGSTLPTRPRPNPDHGRGARRRTCRAGAVRLA
jgi:cyclic nucleotide-binding protein